MIKEMWSLVSKNTFSYCMCWYTVKFFHNFWVMYIEHFQCITTVWVSLCCNIVCSDCKRLAIETSTVKSMSSPFQSRIRQVYILIILNKACKFTRTIWRHIVADVCVLLHQLILASQPGFQKPWENANLSLELLTGEWCPKVHSPNLLNRSCISGVVRIAGIIIIIFHLG